MENVMCMGNMKLHKKCSAGKRKEEIHWTVEK
jgi:hypothetical protein